jgi:hypothetical protein
VDPTDLLPPLPLLLSLLPSFPTGELRTGRASMVDGEAPTGELDGRREGG